MGYNTMANESGSAGLGYEMQHLQRPSTSGSYNRGRRHLEDVFKVEPPNQSVIEEDTSNSAYGFAQYPGDIPHQLQEDDIHGHQRTTSMHRNASDNVGARHVEDRRKWNKSCGSLGRQSLLDHALKIVDYMEQDESLMDGAPNSEYLRNEALRNLPQSLAVKKMVKRNLIASVGGKGKHLSCWTLLKYRISVRFAQLKTGLKGLTYTFELWYGSLKAIEANFGSGVSTYFKFLRWLFVLNLLMMIIGFSFVTVPQIIHHVSDANYSSNASRFALGDLFTGDGYLANTILFYGFYTNASVGGVYSMTTAYFFTVIVIYVLTFVVLSVSVARSYRKSFIETQSGVNNVFANKIFCGWDYSIATGKAFSLKSNALYNELREVLSDLAYGSKKVSPLKKCLALLLQTITNMLVFAVLGGIGFVMWLLLERHRKNEDGAVVTAVYVSAVMVLLPVLFRYVARYENYKTPRATLYVTLFRIFLLDLVVIGVLMVYWLQRAEDEVCWETSLGQEIYRLVIFDFFFSIVSVTLAEILRYVLYKRLWPRLGQPQFDIARNVLSLIYNQTLFWVGFLFAPLLCVLIVAKLFLTWYVRSFALRKFCIPSSKSWRAAQTQTWFLILTFLSLLLVLCVQGFVMINIKVSDCGPFRDYSFIHEVFSLHILDVDEGSDFWIVVSYVGSPGVVTLVFIGMSMLAYYLRAKSNAQIAMVGFLRGRLVFAAKDKEFLLHYITRITKGQWQYNVQEGRDDVSDPRKVAPDNGSVFARGQELPRSSSSSRSEGNSQSSRRRY